MDEQMRSIMNRALVGEVHWRDILDLSCHDPIINQVIKNVRGSSEQMLCSMVVLLCAEKADLLQRAVEERIGSHLSVTVSEEALAPFLKKEKP
jgi:hypothetical protein